MNKWKAIKIGFGNTVRWAKYNIIAAATPALGSLAAYALAHDYYELFDTSLGDLILVAYSVAVGIYSLLKEDNTKTSIPYRGFSKGLTVMAGITCLFLYFTVFNQWTYNPTLKKSVKEHKDITMMVIIIALGILVLNVIMVFLNEYKNCLSDRDEK